MNDRVLRILEFDKIREKVVGLTVSSLGKEKAVKMRPLTNKHKIMEKLKETNDAEEIILKKGSVPLGSMHDIRPSINRVAIGGTLNPGELLKIADSLRGARLLKSFMSDDKVAFDNNCVASLISTLIINKTIENKICNAIIGEDELADNASPQLASLRRKIREYQSLVRDKLNSIIRSDSSKFMQDAVVTVRGDRYVIPVKQEHRDKIPGLIHDISTSGATVFVEPMPVVEINNKIKKARIDEEKEIERILVELTALVSDIVDDLRVNVTISKELDFAFAKAKLSLEYNCTCPDINTERRININGGRHPLLNKDEVVPISLSIGEKYSTLVVTGPNTGGKTVSLKTIGLFTLMAQAGLNIPALSGSELAVFTKVFADIGDEQSIEQSLSTFSSHMKNIVFILKKADIDSLVLFDELGAGTDPTEGAALATSILDTLKEKGITTLATTHYSELKLYAITTDGVENACCEFDVQTLKPTYKLLIGVAGKSNAFAISRRLGLNHNVINRAREYMSTENIEFEEVLSDLEKNRVISEKERTKAKSMRIEIQKQKKELEMKQKKFENEKDKIIKEAKKEARNIIKKSKQEASDLIEKIKELENNEFKGNRQIEAEKIRSDLNKKIDRFDNELTEPILKRRGYVKPPEGLKPGETVEIIDINQKGTIISPPDKDGEAIIQAGIMKINVHVSNLKRLNVQKEQINRINVASIKRSNSGIVKPELDIRGLNVEEATEKVDKYIDDVVMAGLNEVTIIHGKGTGMLRKGVQDYLKHHTHVNSIRNGKYGEGELGVTIVTVK